MSKALMIGIGAAALLALLAYGLGVVAAIGGVALGAICIIYAALNPRQSWAGVAFGIGLLVAAVAIAMLDSGATIAWGSWL